MEMMATHSSAVSGRRDRGTLVIAAPSIDQPSDEEARVRRGELEATDVLSRYSRYSAAVRGGTNNRCSLFAGNIVWKRVNNV